MVKHVQTIRGKFADELFQCVWPFMGLLLKELRVNLLFNEYNSIIRLLKLVEVPENAKTKVKCKNYQKM